MPGKRYNSITIPLEDVPEVVLLQIAQMGHEFADVPAPAYDYEITGELRGGTTPPDSISLDDEEAPAVVPPTVVSRDAPPTVISKDIPPVVVPDPIVPTNIPTERSPVPPLSTEQPLIREQLRPTQPGMSDDMVKLVLEALEKADLQNKAHRKRKEAENKELRKQLAEAKLSTAVARALEKEKKKIELERHQQYVELEFALKQKEKEIKSLHKRHQLDSERVSYAKQR